MAANNAELWDTIDRKAAEGTLTTIEALLYTTLRETRAKLAASEQDNEKLWLELEKFLRVPEGGAPAADAAAAAPAAPAAAADSDDDDDDDQPSADYVSAEELALAAKLQAEKEAAARVKAAEKAAAARVKAAEEEAAAAKARAQAVEEEAAAAADAEMFAYMQKEMSTPKGGLNIRGMLA